MGKVTLTQFVHPHGRQKLVETELPDEVCEMAKTQVLSCEQMPHDETRVVLYSHPVDWNEDEDEEELMFAENNAGDNSPANVLEKLIRLVDSKCATKEGGDNV